MPVEQRKRKILTSLRLSEISAVDNPAQVHARALILKRVEPQGEKDIPMHTNAEAELERLATAQATVTRVSFAKAYSTVLESRPELYGQYLAERSAPAYGAGFTALAKAARESNEAALEARKKPAEKAIEAGAKELHKRAPYGQSFAKTYSEFLDTPEGRKLYAEFVA